MNSEQFSQAYQQARTEDNAQTLIEILPYAKFLGMESYKSEGQWQFRLPPQKHNIGNPVLPALHGGAIAGFMEMSAVVHVFMTMDVERISGHQARVPKIVDFSIDYIRACRLQTTYAACEVLRRGRKVTNITVKVWQQDPSVLTATARAHYLLD